MRLTLSLISIWILGHSAAQVSFYITPTINQKAYFSSSLLPAFNHSGLNHSNQYSTNPYFGISNKLFSYREDVPIGLNIGLKLTETGQSFEVGYSQDGIGSAVEISTLLLSPIPNGLGGENFNEILDYYKSLHFVNRFSMTYVSRYISSKAREFPTVTYNLGVSILFGTANSYSPITLDTNSAPVELMGGGKIIGFEWTNSYNGQTSFMIDVGCRMNLGLNRKNKEGLYLFSLTATYRQGLKTNQFSFYRVFIEDSSKIFSTSYSSSSKGSGVYLEISRKFDLYPWKNKTAQDI